MAPRTDAPSTLRALAVSGISERAPGAGSLARVAAMPCEVCKNMTVLAQDHIHLPNHDARLARVLRPELRAAARPLPRERS